MRSTDSLYDIGSARGSRPDARERLESRMSTRAELGTPAELLADSRKRHGERGFVFDDEN